MRSPTLNRLRVAFNTELRLLTANWIYPLLHVLWIALLYMMFAGHDNRSVQALLETALGRVAIGLLSLIGLFLAGISASRSQRMKFHELEDSFPTGFEVTAGRWLACVLALLFLLVEPITIAALQGQSPAASLLDELPVFLGEAGLTVAFTSAFGWALVTWLKPGRWAYPLLAAGWLSFLLGPTLLADFFPSASLLNFMRQGVSFYSDLWGRLVYGDQLAWFNLFYTGLLLFCLTILASSLSLRRFRRLSLPGSALTVVALGLMVWSGMQYITGVQAAQAAPEARTLQDKPSPFTVTNYDLTPDLSDAHQPRFGADVTIVNRSSAPLDELTFRLNPALAITDASLPFERKNDLVYIHLPEPLSPGETRSLAFQYQGRLRLESISAGVVEASDFIDPRGLRLTPQANWYPVPAGPIETPGLHDPARIRLTVTGSDLPLAANLPAAGENVFEAGAAGWVFLIGSPHLVVEPAGEVTLITSQADLAQVRQYARVFADPLNAILPFFPQAKVQGLILMVLGEEGGLPENTPPVAGYPLVVTQRYALDNMDRLRPLAADLWWLSGGSLDSQYSGPVTSLDRAFSVVVRFLDAYIKEDGDPVQMLAQLQNKTAEQQAEPDPALLALVEIYQQGGQVGIAALLDEMYRRPDELRALPYEALPEWIDAAGGGR